MDCPLKNNLFCGFPYALLIIMHVLTENEENKCWFYVPTKIFTKNILQIINVNRYVHYELLYWLSCISGCFLIQLCLGSYYSIGNMLPYMTSYMRYTLVYWLLNFIMNFTWPHTLNSEGQINPGINGISVIFQCCLMVYLYHGNPTILVYNK